MNLKNHQESPTHVDYTPASATTAGTAIQLPDGTVGILNNDLAASQLGAVQIGGVAKVSTDTATTWSDGAEIWYDVSEGEAVTKSLAMDGDTDFRLGIAVGAQSSGDTVGYVRLNQVRPPLDPVVFEFDCETGVDSTEHVLIPAEMNPNGLLITGIYAVITEQMAGSTEDQGVVTVRDESNNTLATLTASNAAADVVNDIIVGYAAAAATSGDAAVAVAAGEYIDAQVTQATSGGSPAGKMKVYVQAMPLV